jgi:hypothetical protein
MRSFAPATREISGMRSRLRLALPLAIVIAVSATAPALAAGAAEITRFDITFPVDEVDPADCFDGTAHVTGTERVVGQRVDLGDNNFRLHGTLTDAITVAFSNGSTGVWTTQEHFSFVLRGDDAVSTNVHRDTTAVYDSNGQFIGQVSFRIVEHFTTAGGVVRVEFAHPTLTCDF